MIMLNYPRHIQKIGHDWLSACYPLPYPTTIGEKGEPKTTIQGWPLALVGCFGCVCVCFAAVVLRSSSSC